MTTEGGFKKNNFTLKLSNLNRTRGENVLYFVVDYGKCNVHIQLRGTKENRLLHNRLVKFSSQTPNSIVDSQGRHNKANRICLDWLKKANISFRCCHANC